ncbi:hypothetical protein Q5H93_02965 [Hymenobacter sp. ASUV-10]|uniref:Uncharacterized protein n=1 Tax=Hymenobacter aranciens TaxID=3063996 RepID=A0ABT9B633_9BACT|nr:hypothetical protein [Hymenobacter sp. ASUV-10]MDO7873680.1 hypothetical protein [Hymenobacter sp. ASUV-10]
MIQSRTLKNSLTIDLKVNGSVRTAIGNQSTLAGRRILAIITRMNVTGAYAPVGNALAANVGFAYLQLVNSKNEVIHDAFPLSLLDPSISVSGITWIDSPDIDWTKSAVVYPSAAMANDDNGKSILLTIIYE